MILGLRQHPDSLEQEPHDVVVAGLTSIQDYKTNVFSGDHPMYCLVQLPNVRRDHCKIRSTRVDSICRRLRAEKG
jgi:hypothetical protein